MTKKQLRLTKKIYYWSDSIRDYRVSLDMTVLQFARYYEISPQAVYMWESGRREAPYKVTQDVLNWLKKGG